MAFRELEELYGGALEHLFEGPGSEPERFAAGVLPRPAERIVTDKLICEKGRHQYGSSSRVDMVHMYADPATFRLIGLWILSMLFHELPASGRQSAATSLACDFKHNGTFWGQGLFGYSSGSSTIGSAGQGSQCAGPAESVAHDMVITDEDNGFGNDFGAFCRAAAGQERLKTLLGFRGVAPGSVEVQLTTPGAERWVRVGLDYPDFGRREEPDNG